jgi:hypothetical protein
VSSLVTLNQPTCHESVLRKLKRVQTTNNAMPGDTMIKTVKLTLPVILCSMHARLMDHAKEVELRNDLFQIWLGKQPSDHSALGSSSIPDLFFYQTAVQPENNAK